MMNKRNKIWKDAVMCPNYKVSNDGEVMNKKTGRILKASDNSSGYPTVNLYDNGSRISTSVHRIVAETFLGHENAFTEVNHIDGNKHNNRPENLEWVTRGENESHAYRNGLKYGPKHKPVRIIESGETFRSAKECARAIGGYDRNITRCLRGQARSHKGLTFEYASDSDINTNSCNSISSRYIKDRKHTKQVRIMETGEIFPSLVECARAIKGDSASISACLNGTHNTHRGYHFEAI